jgi:hypothetical protein
MRFVSLFAALLFTVVAQTVLSPVKAGEQQHPQTFAYSSVTNPAGPTYITAINDLHKISGYTGAPGAYTAFVSEAPYVKFINVNYPGAVSSQAMAVNNLRSYGGQYQDATGATFGYIRSHTAGVGVQYQSYTEPVLGLNHISCGGGDCHNKQNWSPGNVLAVGTMGAGGYVLDTVTGIKTQLVYPAYSTNGKGHVVGDYDGGVYVYFVVAPWYHKVALPGYHAAGENWQGDIVGSYVGADGQTHGFILYPKMAPLTIDYPGATCGTWATGANQHDEIVGYYCNETGYHGFLAEPQS